MESLNEAVLNLFEFNCPISKKKTNRPRQVLWWNSNLPEDSLSADFSIRQGLDMVTGSPYTMELTT